MLAAGNATIQSILADRLGGDYGIALAMVAGLGAVAFCLLAALGPEAKNVVMNGPKSVEL
jgi:SHS family lactate transporter-like MFS transporter